MESALVREAEIVFGAPTTRHLQERAAGGAAAPAPVDDSPADIAPAGQAADEVSMAENAPALSRLNMTPRQQRRLWRHVESIDGFWEQLQEIERGAVQRLSATAADRRWEVIFLAQRPSTLGATAQVQTQRWLESRGFTLPSVYVVHGSRERIAAALGIDVVLDDRPDHCLDVVADSKARAILVWREDRKFLPAAAKHPGISVVDSVGECFDIFSQMDPAAGGEEPGIVRRLMRFFGRKEPAGA